MILVRTNQIKSNQIYFEAQNMKETKQMKTRMWANAQPDGRPAKYRWRPLFNAAKFG